MLLTSIFFFSPNVSKSILSHSRHLDCVVNPLPHNPTEGHFSKHCGKRRKCWLRAFSPFPTMFSTLPRRISISQLKVILSSANALNTDQSKIVLFGIELSKDSLPHNHNLTLSQTTNFRLFQTQTL